jgi:zinc protease
MFRPRLAALLVTASCATTGRPAPEAETPPPARATVVSDHTEGDVREVVLSNGLRVLLQENHAAPVATFVVYYRVGSRNEHVGITGSSHLLEHLQFKGSKHFPGREGIWGELSRIGANFNATTSYDRTNFYETVPADKLPFAIALEADRMRQSTFTDADRQSEMTVVRNELERGENEPGQLLNEELWSTSIVSHPYHHPVIGWRSDVENVPTSQLRHYYDIYYQPDNAVIAIVGDFKSDEVLRMVIDKFGIYPGGHTFPPVYTAEEPQRGERRFIIRKPGELGLVQLGWHMPPVASSDVPALKTLQLILAGSLDVNEFGDPLDPGISNRLYQALIEKQLATGVDFDYTLMIDENVGSIAARVRPGIPHQQVEDAIRAQVRRLQDEPVTEGELARAKRRALAAFALSHDGTFGQAMALGYFGLISDWRLARDFSSRVDHVTSADVQRVAQKYLGDKTLTVGWFVPDSGGGAAPAPQSSLDIRSYRFAALRSGPPGATPNADAPPSPAPKADAASTTSLSPSWSPIIQKRTLANGLRIVVQENHSSPTVSIAGSMDAGGVHEKPDQLGIAGVTCDLLERGTVRHTKFDLAAQLEDVGASFGFGDGFEQVSLGGAALKSDLNRVLDVMTEDLLEPAFPEEELKKAVAERIAGVEQAEDSTHVKARRKLMQGLYPVGHPLYAYDPSHVIQRYQQITRDQVQAWHRTWYGPDRMVITIVGDVSASDVFDRIEARLGRWARVGGPPVSVPLVPLREQAAREVIPVPDKANVDILMGHQESLRRVDPDYYPAMLANYVLGGPSGMLFKHVRNDLGLTYGIDSNVLATQIAGPWTLSLTVNPDAVEKSIAATQQVLHDWHTNGVHAVDLDHAKTEIVGLFEVSLGTNAGLASVLNEYEVLGLGADFVKEHPKRVLSTSLDAVNAAIPKYFFPDRLLTVISGTVPGASAPAAERGTP